MDKQELIEFLDGEIRGVKENIAFKDGMNWCAQLVERYLDLNEPEITTEQAWEKIAEKYDKSTANVKADFEDWINSGSTQTKEKQEIPQFVAKEIPSAPKEALDRYYNPGVYIVSPYSYKVINWIEGHFDIFLQALVNGYTEKAPVWIVKAPYDRYFGGFLEKGQHAEINFSHINKDNAQKFEDKNKAEAVATLVDGEVEEWSE